MSRQRAIQAAQLLELAHQALDAARATDRAAVQLATAVYPLDQADARAKLQETRATADAAELALFDAIHALAASAPLGRPSATELPALVYMPGPPRRRWWSILRP